MKNMLLKIAILFLLVLPISAFTKVPSAPANHVNKRSAILHTVRNITSEHGNVYAKESTYVGGMTGKTSADKDQVQLYPSLRELRPIDEVFTVTHGGATVQIQVIPAVGHTQRDGQWQASLGTWNFKYEEINTYTGVIHVQSGGYLDIAYQSTEMKLGEQERVVHYGLSGNPHAVRLSKRRLKEASVYQNSSNPPTPVLSYQPPPDIIIVQMGITPEGPYFQPIFDYMVSKE